MAKEYEKLSVNISKKLFGIIKKEVDDSDDISVTISTKVREILKAHYEKELKEEK